LFVAPKIIGADGISVVGPCGVETMAQVITLRDVVVQRLEDDDLQESFCTT
jgi:riboflavin biosynthesis pyrimidine reductase